MKSQVPLSLLGAVVLGLTVAAANDSVLLGREAVLSGEVSGGSSAAPAQALTNSRGVPIVAENRAAAPAPRPGSPPTSRPDSGTMTRSTVSEVLPDSSHIVVKVDTTPTHYRYTRDTQFLDEQGGVLSADAVKAGTNATLHFTRTDGDLVLTKVVVNGTSRPLLGQNAQVRAEVPVEP